MVGPLQIMIVEDDTAWAYLVAARLADLENVDLNVRTIHQGEAAIELAKEEPFDLCMVDIRLGSMEGFEVIKQMHQLIPDSSMVLMTGLDESEDLEKKAASSGAQELVYKDHFDERALQAIIHSAQHRKLMRMASSPDPVSH